MEREIYHIYSKGENTLFRDEDDYIFVMNKLPIVAMETESLVHAFCIMSTHFHLIVETECPQEFADKLVSVYIRHLKLGLRRSFVVTDYRKLCSIGQIKDCVEYVLRNPVHHDVAVNVFQYPYSSIGCYFSGALKQRERYSGEGDEIAALMSRLIRPAGELTRREKQNIFGSSMVDERLMVMGGRVIIPESYVTTSKIEGVYKTFSGFYYGMTSKKESSGSESSLAAYKISDLKVCRLIDKWCEQMGVENFLSLETWQKEMLREVLIMAEASSEQISRCLWEKA